MKDIIIKNPSKKILIYSKSEKMLQNMFWNLKKDFQVDLIHTAMNEKVQEEIIKNNCQILCTNKLFLKNNFDVAIMSEPRSLVTSFIKNLRNFQKNAIIYNIILEPKIAGYRGLEKLGIHYKGVIDSTS